MQVRMISDIHRLQLGSTSNDAILNTALVSAAADLEETAVSPVSVPGVGNPPVVSAVISAPAQDLDGMATELLTRDVLVNAGLVGHEVLVDGEGSLNGTVGHDLSLDGRDVGGNRVRAGTEVLVLRERSVVLASLGALGGVLDITARRQLADDVVVASGHLVRVAALLGAVVSTSDDTNGVPVVPSSRGVTTLATLTTSEDAACGETECVRIANNKEKQKYAVRTYKTPGLQQPGRAVEHPWKQCRYGQSWPPQHRKPSMNRRHPGRERPW